MIAVNGIFSEFRTSLERRWMLFGAAEGIPTPDPRITNAVLYRLSYRGKPSI